MLYIKLWSLSMMNLSRRQEKQAPSTACTLGFHQECPQDHSVTHHKGYTITNPWKWVAIVTLNFWEEWGYPPYR